MPKRRLLKPAIPTLVAGLALTAAAPFAYDWLRGTPALQSRNPAPAPAAQDTHLTLVTPPENLPTAMEPPAVEGLLTPTNRAVPQERQMAALPANEQESLNQAMREARYAALPLMASHAAQPINEGVRLFAANPDQQLSLRFTDQEVRLNSNRPGSFWSASISFTGESGGMPSADHGAVVYHHASGIEETYDNRGEGIEHSFTVPSAPASGTETLRYDFTLSGLTAERDRDRPGDLTFVDALGEARLGYRSLYVADATGKELPAHMEPTGSGFALVMNARGAEYPLHVDPLIVSMDQTIGPEFTAAASEAGINRGLAMDGDTAIYATGGKVVILKRGESGWQQQAQIPVVAGLSFGQSIDLEGDVAVIGAPSFGSLPVTGSAFVFRRTGDTWTQEAELKAADGTTGDFFGAAVAISGDNVVVGAYRATLAGNPDLSGAAYFFSRQNGEWSQKAQVTSPALSQTGQFGFSVAIDGTHAAVGSIWDRTAGVRIGGVYTYELTGGSWVQGQSLVPPGSGEASDLGRSIAIDDGRLIFSSHYASTDPDDYWAGAWVYRFENGAWVIESNLPASQYGSERVALDGNIALVGNPGETNDTYYLAGSVQVFIRTGTTWTKGPLVHPPDPASEDQFGTSLAVSGSYFLALAPGDDTLAGNNLGTLRLFKSDGTAWTQEQLIDGGSATSNDGLGQSLAIQGNTAVAGAVGDMNPAGERGSISIFEREGNLWTLKSKHYAPRTTFTSAQSGVSVAIDGDTLAVGAGTNPGAPGGEVHVFRKTANAWNYEAELVPTSRGGLIQFGKAVAIDGNTVIVGAWRTAIAANTFQQTGVAFIFERTGSTWAEVKSLEPEDLIDYQQFGYSVALSGDTAFVGASGPSYPTNAAYSVYVYRREESGWTYRETLRPGATPEERQGLGNCLAASGDTLVAGAPYALNPGAGGGKVYIYRKGADRWNLESTLLSPETSGTNFGLSVAIYHNTVVAGGTTRTHVYERSPQNVWTLGASFSNPEPAATSTAFGHAVAIWGQRVLVSAYLANGLTPAGTVVNAEGHIYSFVLPELAPSITTNGSVTLNRKTGLMEQTVTFTNTSGQELSGFDLLVQGLPAGVTLNNGTTNANGQPVIQLRQTIAPGATVTLVIEYYSPTRSTALSPELSLVMELPETATFTAATGFAVDRVEWLFTGGLLIEFPSTPGSRYEVQYSNDGTNWLTSPIPITAAGNRVQWIDRGLPRTNATPTAQSGRLYRVRNVTTAEAP